MNREEASNIQKRLISSGEGLTEADIRIVIPREGDPPSHGYQIHIKSDRISNNLTSVKALAAEYNLAVDDSRKGLIIILRPCFMDYSGPKNKWE